MELAESDVHAALSAMGLPAERVRPASTLLAFYLEHLWRSNARFGLISREDAASPQRLLSRHILDSVAVWKPVQAALRRHGARRLVDLGTGAGLPGLPLACVLPELDETLLVDRRGKRIAFLLGVLPALRRLASTLPEPFELNMRAIEADSARLHHQPGVALADAVVVFRAYQPTTEELLATLAAVFPAGTPVLALKGRSETAAAEYEILAASGHAEDARLEPLSTTDADPARLEAAAPRTTDADPARLEAAAPPATGEGERSLLSWRVRQPSGDVSPTVQKS